MGQRLSPRGFLHQTDDYKSGAVVAQRAGDVVTRRMQPHVYQPLLASSSDGYWPAGALGDRRLDGQWQELTPTLEPCCAVFPHSQHAPGPTGRLRLGAVAALLLLPAPRPGFPGSVDFMRCSHESASPFPQRAKPYRLALRLACASRGRPASPGRRPASIPNRRGVSGSVIGDDVLYSIGGGRAVSMGGAGNMQSIGVGIGWNSNLICGDMSITTTLQNQLNGITNGFQQIASNVIQNATSAVASLPALIIQRADPGLYNLLTNGVLQARLDFDRSR